MLCSQVVCVATQRATWHLSCTDWWQHLPSYSGRPSLPSPWDNFSVWRSSLQIISQACIPVLHRLHLEQRTGPPQAMLRWQITESHRGGEPRTVRKNRRHHWSRSRTSSWEENKAEAAAKYWNTRDSWKKVKLWLAHIGLRSNVQGLREADFIKPTLPYCRKSLLHPQVMQHAYSSTCATETLS